MLYDIVSPVIFFLSLGGIILITSRVVIRIRRQQFAADLHSPTATPATSTSVFGVQSTEAVSSFIQPSKKSVRVIGSRLDLFRQRIYDNVGAARAWRQQRREAKTSITEAKAAAQVTSPQSRLSHAFQNLKELPARLRQKVTARRQEANRLVIQTPAAPAVAPATFTLKRVLKEEPSAPAVSPPSRPLDSHRHSLVRRTHPAETLAPKAKAYAALSAQQYDKVEDVMVPYIVKHPKDTEAYMLLGKAALGRQAWSEAIEIFEQVVSWNEQENGAYAGLGTAAYRAGKFTRALQALQRAHDANPRDRAVLEHLLAIAQKLDNHGLLHSLQEKIDQLPAVQENQTTAVR